MVRLDEAIALAERGCRIFPIFGIDPDTLKCDCKNSPACDNGDNAGKHPITITGVKEATSNVRQVRKWFSEYSNANIGLATGEGSGIVVLDVDGSRGVQALGGRELPKTPTVTTGRADGGVHYYFAHPGGRVKNIVGGVARNDRLGFGLDLRGDGGYVIVPPSLHKSGKLYQWGEPLTTELAPLPQWLRDIIEDTSIGLAGSGGGKITKGGRNVTLASLAGSMRRRGASENEILAALRVRNAEQCDPPLSDDEIQKITLSIGSKPYAVASDPTINVSVFDPIFGEITPTDLCRYAGWTDVGNAEAFVSLYGNNLRFDHTRKRWLIWPDGGSAWLEDEEGIALKALMATIQMRGIVAASLPQSDQAEKEGLEKWMNQSEKGNHATTALKFASHMEPVATNAKKFDAHPYWLNFTNGTLDLESLVFRESDPSDNLTRQMATFYDPASKAPLWEAFINQVFGDDETVISYVQRALGYCLTGDTREHALFIAYGHGANGKSTLLNTIRRALGTYATVTAFKTFDADNRNEYGNDLAVLKGTRFVTAIESEAHKRLAEARVKTVTGGDNIACRFLFGEFFQMTPQFKVWLAVNHKPVIKGTDHGIWRRVHLIPFLQTFGESPGHLPIDRTMDLKLSQELPGIANWLLDGYQQWTNHGLRPPAVVIQATEDYKAESDYVSQWLQDETESDAEAKLGAKEAYQNFRDYLKAIGEESDKATPTMKAWGMSMADKGYVKSRTASGIVYQGFRIRPRKLGERGN